MQGGRHEAWAKDEYENIELLSSSSNKFKREFVYFEKNTARFSYQFCLKVYKSEIYFCMQTFRAAVDIWMLTEFSVLFISATLWNERLNALESTIFYVSCFI